MNKKKALVLLIKEILDQIDETSAIVAQGGDANVSRHILRDMCSVLSDLDPDLQSLYFEILPTLSAALQPRTKPVYSKDSALLSKNIKRDFIERIREDLEIVAA